VGNGVLFIRLRLNRLAAFGHGRAQVILELMTDTILADRMGQMDESVTLALNARANQMAKDGKTVYNLTAGELSSDTPDHIQEAVAKTLSQNKYTPVAGLPQLRAAIADNSREFYGLDWIKAENVVVTSGAKPALYASLLAIINPGDEVVVPVPYWVSYRQLIELVGGVMVEVDLTETYDLDVEAITRAITPKTKAIILNSPHNPTGAVFSSSALKDAAKVINARGITVISDDIYSKLVYDVSFTLVPTCGFERVIIINGFSKSQALTGWRIGYVISDTGVAKATTSVLSHVTGNASLPAQQAGLAASVRGDVPPAATTATLAAQRKLADDALTKIPGIGHNLPGGAFYIYLDVRAITKDSATWCERLLTEFGVALVPGEAFGTPGFARLTFAGDVDTLARGIAKLSEFVSGGN
jgi:aspartate aminotransferase